MPNMNNILKAVGVSKTYNMGQLKVEALKHINLSFDEGSFTAVVGKSGSGKSTLLHVLGTIDHATTGKIYVEGQDITDMKDKDLALLRRRRIGFVFQEYNLLPEFTVYENITMPILIDGKKPDSDFIDELIHTLGLDEEINKYPNQLSGGQQQRTAIARALANKPVIVFADEPTGQLDGKTGEEVADLLRISGKKFNQTILLVTHDKQLAQYADRIITIVDGEIRSDWGDSHEEHA